MTYKRFLAVSAAIAAAVLFGACASTDDSAQKPPAAQKTAQKAKPSAQKTASEKPARKRIVAPAKVAAVETPAHSHEAEATAPAKAETTPETTPVGESVAVAEPESDASATPPAPPDASAESAAPEAAPAGKSVQTPESVAKTDSPTVPAAGEVESRPIAFRCAYWKRPDSEDRPELYLKKDGEYKRCDIFELSFPAVHMVETPVIFYTKKGNKYVEHSYVNTEGLDDCAAIILPDGIIYAFSVSPDAAPIGSVVIGNFWRRDGVRGKIHFRKNIPDEEFFLKYGECYISTPVKPSSPDERICDIELSADENGERKVLYSSSGPLLNDSACTYLWAVPRAETDPDNSSVRPDFRTFRIFRKK